MKFTKLAKSDKFEYMMLSRLIQDAKYFIDYPDLKHLWARTLDEHIKQMKEQYAKLDPKPEWTSEEEINSLAKQMKESYTNHWNEVHPDNKIEAAIQQPNKPKPTTMLPDNMQWAWDPEAADWVAVLKDNTNTTPPLYDPNNQNVVNQTTSYMSNIKSELRDNGNISDYLALDDGTGTIILVNDKNENFEILLKHRDLDNKIIIKELMNKEDLFNGIKKVDFTKKYNTFKNDLDKVNISIDDLKHYSDQVNKDLKETLLNKKQSSCLSKFLDGPQFSKEIKIEAGLIKDGLIKYAGFDFNHGTKYTITTKGLEVLRKASEAEHNEALNEREKLAYMFGFNTDEVSTLDTTGKVIKQSARKWTICEADGTELGEVEADSELDAKIKFGIEHPEYADSQSICAKEVKAGLEYGGAFEYNDYKIDLFNDTDGGATFVIYAPKGKTVNHESMYKGTASTMDEAITKAYNIIDGSKEIDAKYEETTETHEPYPNPSETPNDHIILENHDGWVNTASFEDDIRKQFQQPHQKLPNSDRDLALLEKQILEITDEDTRDTVRKIFDEFQFSNKEAAEKRPYTEEEKRLLPLFRLLNQHIAKKEIQTVEDPQKDGNIVVTGQAEVINDLEHEVKDLGFHCEPVAEITDEDYIGYNIYSLRIFTK